MNHAPFALGVIPARAHSSRFPFKVIQKILGKPLIQHVYENSKKAATLSRVLIATDHSDVLRTAMGFGAEAVMTPEFNSGSDRVAFLAKDASEEIIVNLQGDEPLLRSEDIDRLVLALRKNPKWDIATLAVRLDGFEIGNPNVVKIYLKENGEARSFTRKPEGILKHIGIYAYRKEALLKFCRLPQSPMEISERLEQLRAIENGMNIGVVEIETDTIAVDTPEDILKVETRMKLEERNR